MVTEDKIIGVDHGLGAPLAQYVENTIVDPLTDGRHKLLRDAARELWNLKPSNSTNIEPSAPDLNVGIDAATAAQVEYACTVLPRAARSLVELRKLAGTPIDMAALIKAPDELFLADSEWAGAAYAATQDTDKDKEGNVPYIQPHDQSGVQLESRAMLEHALAYAADLIAELAAGMNGDGSQPQSQGSDDDAPMAVDIDREDDRHGRQDGKEDPKMRELRLNLLALAKRAPLDKIARLPADLVPEKIRHIVPTITQSQ